MKKVFILSLFLVLGLVSPVFAVPNPAADFCLNQGYELVSGQCVFPDGESCEQRAFFNGECGENYKVEIYCKRGGEKIRFGQCCEGLIPILDNAPDKVGQCIDKVGGWAICSACGNRTCEQWENACNCPLDCELEKNYWVFYALGGINIFVIAAAFYIFVKR